MTRIRLRNKKKLSHRLFPERQIFHRSDGSVRFLTLTPRFQMMGMAIGMALFCWFGYATVDFFIQLPQRGKAPAEMVRENESYRNDLRQARAKEASALSLLEERTVAFDRASGEFEQRHEMLGSLLEQMLGESGLDAAADGEARSSAMIRVTLDKAQRRSDRPSVAPPAENSGDGARSRLNRLKREQLHFLDTMESAIVDRIEHLHGVVDMTGVNFRQLLKQASKIDNIGGPHIRLPTAADSFSLRVRQVAERLRESMLIEELINSVPLGAPVGAQYRLTSPFGRRLDPFTRRMAWHAGLDMAAWPNSPIIATAAGKVTYAGNKGGYGKVVELDHGFGFKSRYGHLRSITVRRGENVQHGQNIGTMGSSGRSTGVHLHYEVSFDDNVYNPAPFITAGEHVIR